MAIDFDTVATFINGESVINCTPHPIVFLDNGVEITVFPCGATLLANPVEKHAYWLGNVEIVQTTFVTSREGDLEWSDIRQEIGDVLIIGSIISAQAWPGEVYALVSAPGYERAAPADKRFLTNKFITF